MAGLKGSSGDSFMATWEKIKAFLKVDDALAPGRNHHVDALKGFTIICVVFAHSIQIHHPNFNENRVYLIMFTWAMPLFMLLSGFILSLQLKNTLFGYLKKNTLRLIVPFFIWALVSYVLFHAVHGANPLAYVWSVVKAPGSGLWFLWVLFINSTFLFFVLKLVEINHWKRWENYFVVAAILFSRLASADIFALSEVKVYFPYYAAGFFAYKYYDVLKAKRKIFYAVALIAFPVLVFGYRRNEFPTFYPMLQQIFGETGIARLIVSIYKYAVAFAGMAFSSFLLELVRKSRLYAVLCWVGTLSLDIYVCHATFIFLPGFGSGGWQYFSVGLMAILGSLALTLLVLKRFRITRMLFLGENR
jgi:fucose 4-O-acetylase-like acetyltransferase